VLIAPDSGVVPNSFAGYTLIDDVVGGGMGSACY
jgi:hypothetical protein